MTATSSARGPLEKRAVIRTQSSHSGSLSRAGAGSRDAMGKLMFTPFRQGELRGAGGRPPGGRLPGAAGGSRGTPLLAGLSHGPQPRLAERLSGFSSPLAPRNIAWPGRFQAVPAWLSASRSPAAGSGAPSGNSEVLPNGRHAQVQRSGLPLRTFPPAGAEPGPAPARSRYALRVSRGARLPGAFTGFRGGK